MAVVTMNATSRFEPQMKRAFWFTCLVVVAGALSPQGPDQATVVLSDKLVHAGAFFVLSIFGLKAYSTRPALVIAALFVLGGSIEVAQGFTATRSQEWGDLWADCLGVCLGYAAITCLNRVGTAQKSTQ